MFNLYQYQAHARAFTLSNPHTYTHLHIAQFPNDLG